MHRGEADKGTQCLHSVEPCLGFLNMVQTEHGTKKLAEGSKILG